MRCSLNSDSGFTLVELIVATFVFVIILMITASSFEIVLNKGSIVQKSEESNIEGVVGLEMLRHDLTQAGLGLFSDDLAIPTFAEAAAIPASNYNDASGVPRAIVTDENLNLGNNAVILTGTDYLAIKSTSVGRNNVAQQWTYVTDTGVPHLWGINDFVDNTNKLIVLEQTYSKGKGEVVRTLKQISTTNFAISYDPAGNFRDMNGNYVTNYTPSTGKTFYLYGIGTGNVAFTLRAPFNRADYFVRRLAAETPPSCSPAAGVLYKAVMSQADGTMTPTIPLLDCVADMQIILGWNTQAEPEKSNAIDAYSNADASTLTGNLNGVDLTAVMTNPEEVRKRLRQIKVYILAQDGVFDRNFRNTNTTFVVGDTTLGETPLTKTVDLTTANMLNYRWKLYRVVVRPKNLS